ETLFQVASMSMPVSAWVVMTLVEDGRLDLDQPVSTYLTRWELPPSEFNTDAVTVRRLLSHTAGLTDGLGYLGFAPGDEPQSLEESLMRATDALPPGDGIIAVGNPPGAAWQYSGGGYTILQLLVEEVTGQSFSNYADQAVLDPLGMTSAQFGWSDDLEARLAGNYSGDRQTDDVLRFSSLAAAELYATASEMALFAAAAAEGPNGEPAGRDVLSAQTVGRIISPHSEAVQGSVPVWTLGYQLYQQTETGYVIGHQGTNVPGLFHVFLVDPATGDGIVMMGTGGPVAPRLACEWITWNTGRISNACTPFFVVPAIRPAVIVAFGGIIVIAIAVYILVPLIAPRVGQRIGEGATESE
ncbi:MAG: beta-lactamase family protein, partial [Chloroflexi bacterium]|nr:beta-lactamase family protein [Chloroflexota bacterium]